MQNIHVKRYANPAAIGYQGAIEPEDRSWVVFVAADGEATLWRRVENVTLDDTDGTKIEHAYVDVELPGHMTPGHPLHSMGEPPFPAFDPAADKPLDFTVTPMREPMMDAIDGAGHAKEDEFYPNRRDGFIATLNCRNIGSWGPTEHDAVRGLLNYVAKLCVAGCLDHTGQPMTHRGSNRRYKAVFGESR